MAEVTVPVGMYDELRDENGGVCLSCGSYQWGIEPDAKRFRCEECGEKRVYGSEELMIMGRVV